MEKLKENKLAVKIICVVLSLLLWIYVSYQENPTMSKTVRNIPLAIAGEQALKENGFSVYSISEKGVDVKVTAKRLSLRKLNNKTLSAVINVSSIKKSGTYTMPAAISSSISSTASFYVKGNDITVVIEPIEKATYSVTPNISKNTDSDVIIRSVELSSKTVKISAPKSILNAISEITTEEIIPEDKNTTKAEGIKLIALGKDGTVIEGVAFSPETVDVVYTFYDVKNVPVVVKTTNDEEHELPDAYKVKIYGYGEEFDKINKIYTHPVSSSKIDGDAEYSVKLNIPSNVMTVSETEIIVKP